MQKHHIICKQQKRPAFRQRQKNNIEAQNASERQDGVQRRIQARVGTILFQKRLVHGPILQLQPQRKTADKVMMVDLKWLNIRILIFSLMCSILANV